MNIPFVSFEKMHNEIKDEVLAKMQEIYEKNWFIQGPEVTAFEQEFAAYCGTKYCVGCGNGLDALFLALKAYGIKEGDEIEVKLIDIDPKTGKFKLSRKVLLPRPEKK